MAAGDVRRRVGRVVSTLVCLALFLALAPVRLARADEPKTVRVGYYENEVFQEGASEDAVKTGYAYEYYRKISEYTGWRYEYVYGDYGDLYQMLLDGDIDLLAGLAWREERASLIGYPSAPMGNEVYNLVKHDTDDSITNDPATLEGKTIGVLDSAMVDVLQGYLDGNQVKADIRTYRDYGALFDAFDAAELDLMAAEGDGAYGRNHAEVVAPFGSSDYYLCTSIARPDILAELNVAQSQLAVEEPNYLSSLRARYYSVSISSRAFSTAEREWLVTHDTLHVGYLENYLPYSDTDDEGQVTGIVSGIVPAMLNGMGITSVNVTYAGYQSYDDMIDDMTLGVIDVAFPVGGGLYFSEENGIYQSTPVASAPTEIVYKGEFTEETTTVFAVNENNRMQYYFVRTNYPDAETRFYPSIDACLKAVLAGEVSCTTLNGLRANEIMRNRDYKGLSLYQPSITDDRCFGVEIGDEGLLKLLNRGVSVVGSDYAQSVSHRYASGLYSYGITDMIRDHMAFFGGVILALAALVIFLLARDSRRAKAQKEELAGALASAEQANRAKTEFLNNMSHDIRTPMNAIVGFTALAEESIDDKEKVRDYLWRVNVSSQHLLSLINDILDMSRIESGKMTLDESEVSLAELVEGLRAITLDSATTKGVDLTFETAGIAHEWVKTDCLRLSQVLLNLLSNAIKFTPEGGSVRFAVNEREALEAGVATYEFRVSDTGIGMSEEFQQNLFEAFSRERTSTVSGIQGTGLGTAIAKSIVDMMGGTITVRSELDKGSEFVVQVSLATTEGPQGGLRQPAAAQGTASATTEMDAYAERFAGRRVLLAEDNAANQMIAEAILTKYGLAVDIAGDGVAAVRMMEEAPADTYDIVLMDIQMPNMDGYEAARRIRNFDDQAKAHVPIVAVTANAFEEDRQVALAAGMDAHLAKPYDIPQILRTLDELLG